MEILEPAHSQFSVEFTCSRCGARLRAEANDVRFGRFGVRDESEPHYYVVCPECEEIRFLKDKTIPVMVRRQAKERSER